MKQRAVIKNRRMVYPDNPFWSETKLQIKGKRITVATGAYVSEEGEHVEAAGVHVTRRVDAEQFVKVYTGRMKAIFELKPTTLKVIQYLLAQIQKEPNTDGIYLNWLSAERYFSEQDINASRTSFQRSLNELCEKGFIAPSAMPSIFWINPGFFWNGDRMRFVEDYVMDS